MITATAAQARMKFADLLHRVMDDKEFVMLTRYGKPAVALVPLNPRMVKLLERAIAEDKVLAALEAGDEENDLTAEEVSAFLHRRYAGR